MRELNFVYRYKTLYRYLWKFLYQKIHKILSIKKIININTAENEKRNKIIKHHKK